MLNSRTHTLTLIALMTALLAVSAYIRIPIPVIPVTLQCEVVILGALLWGSKVSVSAAVIYIIMGLLGLPVFSGGGGVHYALMPTFGYLIGFIPCAMIAGVRRWNKYLRAYLGLGLIYAAGAGYLYILTEYILNAPIPFGIIVTSSCVTLPVDLILTFFAVKLANKKEQ